MSSPRKELYVENNDANDTSTTKTTTTVIDQLQIRDVLPREDIQQPDMPLTAHDHDTRADVHMDEAKKWKDVSNSKDHYLGLFIQAIAEYTKAIDLSLEKDKKDEYIAKRANAYRKRGEFRQARDKDNVLAQLQDFEAAIRDNPYCHKSRFNSAMMLPNNQEFAIYKLEALNIVIGLNSTVAKYYNGRGDLSKYLKKPEDALKDYIKALNLQPNCPTNKSKQDLLELILLLDETKQKEYLKECLNAQSTLGKRMWKPENWLVTKTNLFNSPDEYWESVKCNYGKGTLNRVCDLLKKLEGEDFHDPRITNGNGKDHNITFENL